MTHPGPIPPPHRSPIAVTSRLTRAWRYLVGPEYREAGPRCRECDYDLRCLPRGARCPECGTIYASPSTSTVPVFRRRHAAAHLGLPTFVASTLATLFLITLRITPASLWLVLLLLLFAAVVILTCAVIAQSNATVFLQLADPTFIHSRRTPNTFLIIALFCLHVAVSLSLAVLILNYFH